MSDKLVFHRLPHAVDIPAKQRDGDAGWDLPATENIHIKKGKTIFVNTGVIVEIPRGYVGLLYPRSGLGVKHGIVLANGTGVIDSNYRGELKAVMVNNGTKDYNIKRGDRVCQLVVVPIFSGTIITNPTAESVTKTSRGKSGFGSSGK